MPGAIEYQLLFHFDDQVQTLSRVCQLVQTWKHETRYACGSRLETRRLQPTFERYFTVTVITEHAPGIVLCKSSPS